MLIHRLFNKYTLLSFAGLFILSFLSWGIFSEYFLKLFLFEPSPEFPDKSAYFDFAFDFQGYIREGFTLIQLAAPILVTFSALHFFEEKEGFFQHAYNRIKRYKPFVFKSMVSHAVISSLALFLGYILFYLLGLLLTSTDVNIINSRDLFADVLGKDFFGKHMFIYYMLEGILKNILFTFVYAMFSMSIALFTEKNYLMIIIPTLYYVIPSILFSAIEIPNLDLYAISPTYPLVAAGAVEPSTAVVLLNLLPPLLFALVAMCIHFRGAEKLGK